ncbi:unnamed protein product [Clonostachys solani]|uniref:Uncharacterized protein n=1 Tax=Clonostachys solani TaxID=160281 RepID=A0A9N9ZK91_9HYPO|nr:unnamed protein product [Clonostachys solani]
MLFPGSDLKDVAPKRKDAPVAKDKAGPALGCRGISCQLPQFSLGKDSLGRAIFRGPQDSNNKAGPPNAGPAKTGPPKTDPKLKCRGSDLDSDCSSESESKTAGTGDPGAGSGLNSQGNLLNLTHRPKPSVEGGDGSGGHGSPSETEIDSLPGLTYSGSNPFYSPGQTPPREDKVPLDPNRRNQILHEYGDNEHSFYQMTWPDVYRPLPPDTKYIGLKFGDGDDGRAGDYDTHTGSTYSFKASQGQPAGDAVKIGLWKAKLKKAELTGGPSPEPIPEMSLSNDDGMDTPSSRTLDNTTSSRQYDGTDFRKGTNRLTRMSNWAPTYKHEMATVGKTPEEEKKKLETPEQAEEKRKKAELAKEKKEEKKKENTKLEGLVKNAMAAHSEKKKNGGEPQPNPPKNKGEETKSEIPKEDGDGSESE